MNPSRNVLISVIVVLFILPNLLTATPVRGAMVSQNTFFTPLKEPASESGFPAANDRLNGINLTSDPVFVGAGDIANCSSNNDEATANLLDGISGTVYTSGDNAYPNGTAAEFANCYHPSWGRHKSRTYPSAGNHDYHVTNAAGYFGYFGTVAGQAGKGFYSHDLGAWHIIVLNSNIATSAGSEQEQWLRADLAAHPTTCTLAYWHHPRFSSGDANGGHRSDNRMQPLWQALYDYGADVVLNGHNHSYERFAPQSPNGTADPSRGIRQFVIGSGGAPLYPMGAPIANSEVRNDDTHGVLKFTLHSSSYQWNFIPVAGKTFADAGSANCVEGVGTGIFQDVPISHWAWQWIERLYNAGITGGCATNPLRYCPEANVTRAQMAVFLERGMYGSSYTPPAATGSAFGDVPVSHWAAAWIEKLAADGVTDGCGNGYYCPENVATRAQMAVFLLRAKHGAGYTPPAVGSSTGFSDVPKNYWAAAWIKQLAAEGITGGCAANLYCPENQVTRAEMAVFLVRTFNLP